MTEINWLQPRAAVHAELLARGTVEQLLASAHALEGNADWLRYSSGLSPFVFELEAGAKELRQRAKELEG